MPSCHPPTKLPNFVLLSLQVSTLSPEHLKSVLHLAARAPGGDNTQPWTFSWNGNVLTILFDPARARHVLDAGLSAAKISLGCLLESIKIAATQYGFSIEFKYTGLSEEQKQQQKQPAGEVTFISDISDNSLPDPLADALPKRTTDRRPFSKGPLPVREITEISEAFQPNGLAQVHCQSSISPELLDYILAAESLVTRHPSIFLQTLEWIRLSRREIERTLDGMPWRGTGVRTIDYPALQFIRHFPGTFPLLARTAMTKVHLGTMKRLIESSAGLLCFSIPHQQPLALIEAGKLAMRVWLRLTQLGYGVQPLTLSSLSVFNAKIGVLDRDSIRLFGARYAEGEKLLRRSFGISSFNTPAWMLRTGISTPLPASWLTPRKNLDDLLLVTP